MKRRDFLVAAMAGAATTTTASRVFASNAPLEGEAVRTPAKTIRLGWTAKTEPTSIFVSSDPDAQRAYMRPLKAAVRGGSVDLPLAVTPRPYFLLATADGRQIRVAERLLPLQGGRNFRDLGGYRAADGRQVGWGRIYRSGVMSGLTPQDMTYLSGLGIEVICDLRSLPERKEDPNPFLKTESPVVIATDYDMLSMSGFDRATNRAEAIKAFAASYLEFTKALTPQYTDMFARLVRREGALAFNCSAGKDRTGVGAALILSVLGVPRETVIADYALTQVYTPPSLYLNQISSGGSTPGLSAQQAEAFRHMPPEVLQIMMGSDPEVMRHTLAEMDRVYGGPIELTKALFGLTDGKIASLRSAYLI